ncbi:hypothetical protein HJG60_008506 [Phyllostomus discolor]|uniref:Uncharacterized protein n=1 Tax=Phyllostomus discolor TaxID=89673 RepID=A0A833Z8M6_9CHIR|nr:hypothetical protein HJG60_008506 [Phyllostomus discolor]
MCTCDQNSHVCRVGPPTDRLLGKFHTCHQGCQDIYKKIQKGRVHHFQGIIETGSRPLWRQLSSTYQSVAPLHNDVHWNWPLEVLLCWTEDFTCPCYPSGSEDHSLQDADNSLAHCAISQTCRLRL